jgi:hypothetical protein
MPTKLARILFENGITQAKLNRHIDKIVNKKNVEAIKIDGENAEIEGSIGCNLSLIVNGKKKNLKLYTLKKIIAGLNNIFGEERFTVDDIIE